VQNRTDWTSSTKPILHDSVHVGRLDYSFENDGLLDIRLTRKLHLYGNLQIEDEIGVYLYGDSSLTKFRFYFSDSTDGLEAGNWNVIDWFGWQAVRYRIGIDSIVAIEGNGIFDSKIDVAGIQFEGNSGTVGTIFLDDFFLASSKVTRVENKEDSIIPNDPILLQCYPNPFSINSNYSGVTIVFEFPTEWDVSVVNVSIFNTLGQKVRELRNQPLSPGRYEIFWDILDEYKQMVPAGVYFSRVQVGDRKPQTKGMIIFK
jgi:hypothetical protein